MEWRSLAAGLLGEPASQPRQHIADGGKVMARDRSAASDVDRDATWSIDHGKTVFVGRVVADKHRLTPAEWCLGKKIRDRLALAGGSRQQLDHHFSRDRRKCAIARHSRLS